MCERLLLCRSLLFENLVGCRCEHLFKDNCEKSTACEKKLAWLKNQLLHCKKSYQKDDNRENQITEKLEILKKISAKDKLKKKDRASFYNGNSLGMI